MTRVVIWLTPHLTRCRVENQCLQQRRTTLFSSGLVRCNGLDINNMYVCSLCWMILGRVLTHRDGIKGQTEREKHEHRNGFINNKTWRWIHLEATESSIWCAEKRQLTSCYYIIFYSSCCLVLHQSLSCYRSIDRSIYFSNGTLLYSPPFCSSQHRISVK